MPTREGLILETMLTADQVAELLQVHIVTVRRWIRAGQLKAYLGARKTGYRIRQEDLDRFVQSQDRAASAS